MARTYVYRIGDRDIPVIRYFKPDIAEWWLQAGNEHGLFLDIPESAVEIVTTFSRSPFGRDFGRLLVVDE